MKTMAHQVRVDALTGILCRNAFHDQVCALLEQKPRWYAMYFIDINNFKHVNDQLGHAVGDQILKITARRLNAACRKQDLVARYGGDEFVVFCVFKSQGDAHATMKSLCETMSIPMNVNDQLVDFSASVGMACHDDLSHEQCHVPEQCYRDLIELCDNHMYSVKRARKKLDKPE